MKKIVLLFVAITWSLANQAQNAAADFAAMHNAYLANYLSLDFEVTQYASEKDKTGTPAGNGKVRKSKSDYYSVFDRQEMIITGNKMLNIDHQEKKINYYQALPPDKVEKTNAAIMDTFLLEQADSIKYNGTTASGKSYSIYSSGGEAYRTDVIIDVATYLVRDIIYYYPPATTENDYGAYKIAIHYTLLSTTKPADTYFDMKKYVTGGKDLEVTSSYSKYRFTIIN